MLRGRPREGLRLDLPATSLVLPEAEPAGQERPLVAVRPADLGRRVDPERRVAAAFLEVAPLDLLARLQQGAHLPVEEAAGPDAVERTLSRRRK